MAAPVSMNVRRVEEGIGVIEIKGDVTSASENALSSAYDELTEGGVNKILLDFTGLEYMNSGGIGVIVTMLVRANRHQQSLLAYGLSDHYKQIFELTRLDEAIGIHDDETAAVTAARIT